MLTHLHPWQIWFTCGLVLCSVKQCYPALCPDIVKSIEPPSTESSFAPLRHYLIGGGLHNHLEGHYPFFIAHTSSCARPKPSRRLWFYLLRRVFAGCRQPLLRVGPSRHYLYNPCTGAWTHTPSCSPGAPTHYFPGDNGLTSWETRSAHENTPAMQLQQGAVISGVQSFVYLQAPTLARPPGCTHRSMICWAARPFTPRIARLVTCPGMWHHYMSDMGN